MRRYTTLWNVRARNWSCSRAKWSELPCKTQPFKTDAEKYLSADVSTILFTDEKKIFIVSFFLLPDILFWWNKDMEKIFTVVTPKTPKNHQLYATAATKKKDVATECLCTRSTFRQSLMASVGESQVVEKTRVWYLSITKSRLLRGLLS